MLLGTIGASLRFITPKPWIFVAFGTVVLFQFNGEILVLLMVVR